MLEKKRLWAMLLSLTALTCSRAVLAQVAPVHHRITIDQLIDIKHPSNPIWSPDGRHIAFVWDRAGVSNYYLTDASGRSQPVSLTSFATGQVGNAFWSHDGSILYFPHEGDLWEVSATGQGAAHPVWTTPSAEMDIVLSPDGTQVAFVRLSGGSGTNGPGGADLWVRSLADGKELRLAHDDNSIFGINWSPDGTHLAYTAGSKTIHHDESPAYSGAKLIYTVTERTTGQLYVVPVAGGEAVSIGMPRGYGGARWVDATHLVCDRVSSDFKKRTIYEADISGGAARAVHEDVDDKFWSIPGDSGDAGQPSPNGKWIAFLSDVDGWDHLYVMPAAGGDAVQITRGHSESWRPSWSHDSTKIAFDANEADHPGDRHLGIATIGDDPAHATIRMITAGRGTDIAPLWSPDDKRLVYQHTDPYNSADLFAIAATPAAKPVRLSESMPAGIDHSQFVTPQFVHYPGADGKLVPGWLFVPKNLDRTKKHPAIVWIHGDGINQNYDGWHVERNYAVYYSFHQYLLQEGYVVFAPDYRGSIGYGRAWREGVYMNVGTKDAKDAWMAGNYLKTLPYVDGNRIGVWGLSYGGFFTLIAITDQPTLFRAAVDVAGVVDYTMYYGDPYHGSWTASRMGTPEQNPQVYAAASPVSHIDRLQRPLLVLAGTADVNVPFLESVRLIDEALKHDKGDLLSLMIYPGEFHYFARAHVLRDAWHRVDRFFAMYLQPENGTAH